MCKFSTKIQKHGLFSLFIALFTCIYSSSFIMKVGHSSSIAVLIFKDINMHMIKS